MYAVTEVDSPDHVAERLRRRLREDLDAGFADLMREYQQLVYTTVRRLCAHRADAEDLSAEVFLRAYRALREYPAARIDALRPRPWLIAIALNTGRNNVRDRGRRPQQVMLDDVEERPRHEDAFDEVVARLDHRRMLADLTACLPEQRRVAVLLRHVCQLSSAEVAEILGCSEGTARSHVSRGLVSLRALLVERYPALAADMGFDVTDSSPKLRGEEKLNGHKRR